MFSKALLIVLAVLLFPLAPLKAQNTPYNHSLMLVTDNDSYMLQDKDGYYTNGIKIVYDWSRKPADSDDLPKIHSLEIGQLMYNAKNGSYKNIWELDRPVTAYLYGKYGQTIFNSRQDVLQLGIEGGVIGKWALGRQMQEAIHNILGMYKPAEWDYQLNPDWGITASAKWAPQIIHQKQNATFRLEPIAAAQLGNMYANVQLGAALLLGSINANSRSVFWNASLNANDGETESFFYTYPKLTLQAYNATVQGGMFVKEPGFYTGKLNPYFYQQHFGYMYAHGKINFGLAAVYENKQSRTQRRTQWFGSLQLGLRL